MANECLCAAESRAAAALTFPSTTPHHSPPSSLRIPSLRPPPSRQEELPNYYYCCVRACPQQAPLPAVCLLETSLWSKIKSLDECFGCFFWCVLTELPLCVYCIAGVINDVDSETLGFGDSQGEVTLKKNAVVLQYQGTIKQIPNSLI